MNQIFRNITYLSDRSGCGIWRAIWPSTFLNGLSQNLGIQNDYAQQIIFDQNYYKGMSSVKVQRWISDQQKEIFCKFFKPLTDSNSAWLFYEEDDLMFDGTLLNESKRDYLEKKYGNLTEAAIPLYNRGRKAFEGSVVQQNIKDMLNAADFVTVTTDYLKEVYHDLYDVPLDNILAIPNLLPKYIFGDRYDPAKKVKAFGKNKTKPRIGIISSLSHFNVDGVRCDKDGKAVREVKGNDGVSKWFREDNVELKYEDTFQITDDFDDIAEVVRSTVDQFQYVCFGYCPPQIHDLAKAGKIEVHGGVTIMEYASKVENLQLQAVIAPIKKMTFNYCKSFIKTMECAACGIPLFATDCLPYNRVMPKDQLFADQNELKEKLLAFKTWSTDKYNDCVETQWKWLNSPCHEGDFDLKNFWLEDNINIYVNLNRLRKKTLTLSMSNIEAQQQARMKQQAESTIYKNDNGVIITR